MVPVSSSDRDRPGPAHRQAGHAIRFEWGSTGAAAVADGVDGADLAVVVDVLSFTTTLSVALERGITVYPYRWKDERAAAYAAERDAVLAVGRFEARGAGGGVSLSPAHLVDGRGVEGVEGIERIVLPSPNGSSIAFALRDSGAVVVGACLRNATAVARWLEPRVRDGARLAVVAAGERWPDGSLRPAVEDLWGAGAVLAGLAGLGDLALDLSPEATMAAQAYRAVLPGLTQQVIACASGQELVGAGFPDDVAIAAEHDVSTVVPVLRGDAFTGTAASRESRRGAGLSG